MAAALASSVLKKFASINELELEQGSRWLDAVDIRKLTETVTTIRFVIDDAESRQRKDKWVRQWFENVKDVLYDIDDLLDEWCTEILRSSKQQVQEREEDDSVTRRKRCCYSFISCFQSSVSSRYKIIARPRIEEMITRLDLLASQCGEFNLLKEQQQEDRATEIEQQQELTRLSSSFLDEESVFGRDLEKNMIVEKLLKNSSLESDQMDDTGDLYVLCVVGMGGIGKTTLAQLIYNDSKIRSNFDMTMWLCVSDPFDLPRIFKGIIEAVTGQSVDFHGLDHLALLLSKCVEGKRFLLVLDDVWNEDIAKWDILKSCLQRGAKGSCVLVTTRIKNVAYLMSTTDLFSLNLLSLEDSWFLFRKVAFFGRTEQDCQMLEDIGRKLVKRCNGRPLALRVLAGFLRFKSTASEWLHVLESNKWEELLEMGHLIPILYLSYDNLTSHLKQCFTYTSIFPADYNINKDMLIKLWMAQGYLLSYGRDIEPELIGEEYYRGLVVHSFLQDLEKDKNGEVIHCKMHALLHGLALSTSTHSIMEIDNTELKKSTVRHLAISDTDLDYVLLSVCEAKKLSTLKLFNCRWSSPIISPLLFKQLTCLRALDLSFLSFEMLPNEVGKLIHLRYFDLSNTNLKYMPESVCSLYNLQTLILNACRELCKLPKGLEKLINLRHLEIQDTPKLQYLPKGISRLSSLRTLSKFIVEGGCNIGQLKHLHKLKGRIEIVGLSKVENLEEANEAGLNNKGDLKDLILDFSADELEKVGEVDIIKIESVLEGLQPHPNLRNLEINHCQVSKFPSWMVSDSALSNLHTLMIHDCGGYCTELPALGKLPSLKELRIQKLDGVECIGNEFYGIESGGVVKIAFPALEELHIANMANLEHWEIRVEDEEIMPRLCVLFLLDCPKLMSLPNILPNTMKNLRVYDCPKLRSSSLEYLNIKADTGVETTSPLLEELS